jgi:segregation and condensation protein A
MGGMMEETTANLNPVPSAATPAATTISVAGARPELVSGRDGEDLKLIMGEFQGPLDLLLYLIRQEQVDIYDIPVARITDEYLRYLQLMQELDIAIAGDFLVMAATLIEIKSRMLLPRDPLADAADEELLDPRSELINQLLERPVGAVAENEPGIRALTIESLL